MSIKFWLQCQPSMNLRHLFWVKLETAQKCFWSTEDVVYIFINLDGENLEPIVFLICHNEFFNNFNWKCLKVLRWQHQLDWIRTLAQFIPLPWLQTVQFRLWPVCDYSQHCAIQLQIFIQLWSLIFSYYVMVLFHFRCFLAISYDKGLR